MLQTEGPIVEETQTVEDIEKVLVGVDGARRVGWAKYFQTASDLKNMRYTFAYGLGIAARVALVARNMRNRKAIAETVAHVTDEILKDVIGEWPGDFDAIIQGMREAEGLIEAKWGTWDAASKEAAQVRRDVIKKKRGPVVPGRHAIDKDESRMLCGTCERLVARKISETKIEVACQKCKQLTILDLRQE